MRSPILPDLDTFKALAKDANVIPVYTVKTADLLPPLALLCKLPHGNHAFLLESIEGNEIWSRYSLLGISPKLIFKVENDTVTVLQDGREERFIVDNPISKFVELFNSFKLAAPEGVSGMPAGFVGYFAYDSFRYFYPEIELASLDPFEGPEIYLMFTDDLLLVDRFTNLLYIIHNVRLTDGEKPERAYEEAVERVKTLARYVDGALHEEYLWSIVSTTDIEKHSNINEDDFVEMARQAKLAIEQGEAKRLVLAQRWFARLQATPVNMYRAMRYVAPEPYGYYLKMGALEIIGTSPEAMARTSNGNVLLRVVAGERQRPGDPEEDAKVISELQANEAVKQELNLYLEQARIDISRIAEENTVRENGAEIAHTMRMFRYEAGLWGKLRKDTHLVDVVGATLPYPSVVGVPRTSALQIIERLEADRRGVFGGGVGYLGLNGKMDLVAADKTVLIHKGRTHVQIGVPITADTDTKAAYEWGEAKAAALFDALVQAASGLEEKF